MTSPSWYAAFATAAVVLTAAGLAKAVRPGDTARALRAAGLPVTAGMVRVGSGIEAAVGGLALLAGGRLAALLVAISYAGLAGFVGAAMLRETPLRTCGCFGEPDTPPTLLHLVLDAGMAAAGLGAAVHPVGGLPALLRDDAAGGAVLVGLIGVATYLVITGLTVLPRLVTVGGER